MISPSMFLTSLDALPPSAALWRAAEPAAVAALHCPFCSGLAAGTLPREAFGAYIAQDHFFLAAFGDAYAQAATLLPPAVREKHGPAVAALVAGIGSERAGHAASAAQWGVTDISSVEPLAATREYCALLAAAAEQGSLGVLFAAAAPCMRLYAWLGAHLKAVARDGTPYQEWLDAYASEEFEALARTAEELLDAFVTGDAAVGEAHAADEAHDAYLAAMRLELSFFEQVPGVPALAPPPRALATDFDGTLTEQADSTAALLAAAAAAAPDAAAREVEVTALVRNFLAAKKAHDAETATLSPPAALEARAAFEAASYAPLAHALRGAPRAALRAVGEALPLREGALRALGLARARGAAVHVLTLNPSADCVRGALRLHADPTPAAPAAATESAAPAAPAVAPTEAGVTLHCTRLTFDDAGACGGAFVSQIASAADKADAFRAAGLAGSAGSAGDGAGDGAGGGAAYVGDSVSDLPAMLIAALPIAIGGDAALRAAATAQGWAVSPLAAASVALATPAGLPPKVLYEAQSWEEIAAVLLPPPAAGPAGGGVPRVLIVAGSDSGGGAGIQADLKACEAQGTFGMTAITALTAQNTAGVQGVEAPPIEFVATQMRSVLTDLGADALKSGMLPSRELAGLVAAEAAEAGLVHRRGLVVDPVLVTSSGTLLAPPDEVGPIARWLFPLAEVVTPNLPEASVLLGGAEISDLAAMHAAAARLHKLGPRWVLLKGGHLEGEAESVDVLYGGPGRAYELRAPRVATRNTHGTGCTLGSAVAAHLARGHAAPRAARLAKEYVHGALVASAALGLGSGPHGPLHHSYAAHAWPPPPPIGRAATLRGGGAGGGVGGGGGAPRGSGGSGARPALDLSVYVITDAKLHAKHGHEPAAAVAAAIRGGATVVQVREKGLDSRAFAELARSCVAAAAGSGVPVLINDRVDIALASGAAGVHLGQSDLDAATARRLLGDGAIIGVTAKTAALGAAAAAAGADYLGCGAVYPTATKDSSCIGLDGLTEVCAAVDLPVVGIGGITLSNAAAVVGAGARGVAVVSAAFDAADVAAATAELCRALGR